MKEPFLFVEFQGDVNKLFILSKSLKCLNQCFFYNFGLRKASPAKQLLIQHVGFENLRHFFQNQSRAKFKDFSLYLVEWLTSEVSE